MPSTLPSTETTGLVLVTSTVETDPKACCVGHFPTRIVQRLHWLEDADESLTVGQLLARYGLDEGDSIAIRFPTVQEDMQRLAVLIDAAMPAVDLMPRGPNGERPRFETVRDPDEWGADEYRAGVQPEEMR